MTVVVTRAADELELAFGALDVALDAGDAGSVPVPEVVDPDVQPAANMTDAAAAAVMPARRRVRGLFVADLRRAMRSIEALPGVR